MSAPDVPMNSLASKVGKASLWMWALPIVVVIVFVVLAAVLWPTSNPFEIRPRLILSGFPCGLTSIAYSPDSQTVATGGTDGTIRLIHAVDGTQFCRFATKYSQGTEIYPLIFTQDSQRLIAANARQPLYTTIYRKMNPVVKVLDIPSQQLIAELNTEDQGYRFRLLPDQKTLAINVSNQQKEEHLQYWDLNSAKLAKDILITAEPLNATGNKQIAGGSSLDLIIGGRVDSVIQSPDGKSLVVSGIQASTIAVVDLETLKVTHSIPGRRSSGFDEAPQRVEFAPDSQSLLVVRLGGIELWDLSTGKSRWKLPYRGNFMSLDCIQFSNDGKNVAIGGGSTNTGFWVNLGRGLAPLIGKTGNYDWEATLLIVDTTDGSISRRITRQHFRAVDLCLSPDGSSIAVAGADDSKNQHMILIWDLKQPSSSMPNGGQGTTNLTVPDEQLPPENNSKTP